ncbi:LPS assembly lipoprotein LptE [Shimia thalassica]|uniref:LPS assembly lipoprotein LptE n=1 Tax=Shimia thalassica TaxID=1715693 RepID=UPI0026E28689|nr:LPS assembly lipoprotein LptE [Shimia thalassica]MDO6522847.1 LPS assembly lipoprotein LptE [Shimia thalassica]
MSLSNRRYFVMFGGASLALAGCGFTPSYGTNGTASAFLGQTVVDEPTDNVSYLVVRELEDRLGCTPQGIYGLSVSLQTEQRSIAKSISGITSRYDLLATATYALRDLETKEVLTSGKVENFTGYSTTGTTVDTLAAETDAYERLSVILTDQIMAQLLAYAAANPQ